MTTGNAKDHDSNNGKDHDGGIGKEAHGDTKKRILAKTARTSLTQASCLIDQDTAVIDANNEGIPIFQSLSRVCRKVDKKRTRSMTTASRRQTIMTSQQGKTVLLDVTGRHGKDGGDAELLEFNAPTLPRTGSGAEILTATTSSQNYLEPMGIECHFSEKQVGMRTSGMWRYVKWKTLNESEVMREHISDRGDGDTPAWASDELDVDSLAKLKSNQRWSNPRQIDFSFHGGNGSNDK
ncbi:hypothetical protein C8J56DRAFT_903861 [Mycena floridula]|nr:hypothetical protein C8J56DRAFT_903861 [Mycena floridula]